MQSVFENIEQCLNDGTVDPTRIPQEEFYLFSRFQEIFFGRDRGMLFYDGHVQVRADFKSNEALEAPGELGPLHTNVRVQALVIAKRGSLFMCAYEGGRVHPIFNVGWPGGERLSRIGGLHHSADKAPYYRCEDDKFSFHIIGSGWTYEIHTNREEDRPFYYVPPRPR